VRRDNSRLLDDVRRAGTDYRVVCQQLGLYDPDNRHSYRKQAGGLIVRCPHHGERTPSCSVRIGRDGTLGAYCFACGWSGNVFTLVAEVHGLDAKRDFPRVLEIAASVVGIVDVGGGRYDRPPPPAPPPEPPVLEPELFDEMARMLDPIDHHDDVARYVAERLPGCDTSDLRALPVDATGLVDRIAENIGHDEWRRSGLANRTTGGLVWRDHRLCILWRDEAGKVATIQRRLIRPARTTNVPKYVFPSGRKPTVPFGVERIATMGPSTGVAYTEGALDAIAYRVLAKREGFDVCVLGVPSVSIWKGSWAMYAQAREARIAFDRDAAGQKATQQIEDDFWRAQAVLVHVDQPDKPAKDWAENLVALHRAGS
jgi:DNA primase